MSPTLITAGSVAAQPWRNGGGQTRELLTWPASPNWQLRISRADIEEDGPFSAFPGVQRWFAVLEGAGVVLKFPNGSQTLRPGDAPLVFDGADAPGCTLLDGATQDLNVMVQHGSATLQAAGSERWSADFQMRGLYTATPVRWHDGTESLNLEAHTLLWVDDNDDTAWSIEPLNAHPPLAFWIGFTPGDAA